ncbi:hypothetical protein [Sphingobacterium hotanense]|uniref:hypothetical protein n=1 Tax=Sphingobacterium hotanense TaxID=649196 RepID=UPI0011F2234E|nr:hypothetical protein [Sphingobacterium hotanense]
MPLINQIKDNIIFIFRSFFLPDMDVISVDTKRLLSNPNDKKLYLDTVYELKAELEKGGKQTSKTITLSDKTQITLSI